MKLARPVAAAVAAPVAAKVPEITLLFWVVKVITTGMGEAASDWLGRTSIPLAGIAGVLVFVTAMRWQFRQDRYRAVPYWYAVCAIAFVGTIGADAVHLVGVPYPVVAAFYVLVVTALFGYWYRTEGTLSIHSITTTRREVLYWLVVLASFALGTAAGDLTAYTLHLGFLPSAALFAVAIALPALAWRAGASPVACFWTAYVLTRPLGASVADWLGKDKADGLGLGDLPVTLVALALIAALVGWLAVRRSDVQREQELVDA